MSSNRCTNTYQTAKRLQSCKMIIAASSLIEKMLEKGVVNMLVNATERINYNFISVVKLRTKTNTDKLSVYCQLFLQKHF